VGLADSGQCKGDELLYKDGALVTGGLSFAELKALSLIDDRAKRADASADFSQLIRVGLPLPAPKRN